VSLVASTNHDWGARIKASFHRSLELRHAYETELDPGLCGQADTRIKGKFELTGLEDPFEASLQGGCMCKISQIRKRVYVVWVVRQFGQILLRQIADDIRFKDKIRVTALVQGVIFREVGVLHQNGSAALSTSCAALNTGMVGAAESS
jgi:hypothetical protein